MSSMTARPVGAMRGASRSVLRPRSASSFLASALLAGAALLQAWASWMRWADAAGSWSRTDYSVVDHRFDYLFPSAPWENVGAAAQAAGAGYLLAALAVAVLAVGAGSAPVLRGIVLWGFSLPTALIGLHALWSGVIASVSPMVAWAGAAGGVLQLPLACAQLVGLVALGALLSRRPGWASVLGVLAAALLALAYTALGEIAAQFAIAPALGGTPSQDSTSFYELVLAGAAALAALALAAVGAASRRVPS
jgi:hypothetical protein